MRAVYGGGLNMHRFCTAVAVALLATGCAQLPMGENASDAAAIQEPVDAPSPVVVTPDPIAPARDSSPPAAVAAPPEPPPNRLWPRIREGFGMRDLDQR